MPRIRITPPIMLGRRKKPKIGLDNKEVQIAVQKELEPYIKRDDLKTYLADIEKDEKKKRLWDGLSARKKVKLLKYVKAKKEEHYGKKT